MASGKITKRQITSKGVLFTIETPEGDVLSLIKPEQLNIINLMGVKVPSVGAEVGYDMSVNPATGLASTEWAVISL